MSMFLENIIRTYLIEGRTVAKLRNVSAKETAAAFRAKAVDVYAVLVKGTKNSKEIIDLVKAATVASVGTGTETKIAVGENSKFADGNYDYVMSDPLPKKRQIIIVRIFNSFKITQKQVNLNTSKSNTTNSYESDGYIGNSNLFTVTTYKKLLAGEGKSTKNVDDLKSKESELTDPVKTASDIVAGNTQVTDYDITQDGKVVGKFNGTINKDSQPVQGKLVLTDGQFFDGSFKDGKFVSGTCKEKLSNNSTFEGKVLNGVPEVNVTHYLSRPTGEFFEGTLDSSYNPINGSVYSTSAKTEKIADFVAGAYVEIEKPVSIKYTYNVTTDNAEFLKVQQQMLAWLEANGISTAPATSGPYKTYKKLKDAIAGKTVGSYGDVTKSAVALIKGILVNQLKKTIDSDATFIDNTFINLIK